MYRPWFGSCTRAALALESSFAQFIQYLYKLVLLLTAESFLILSVPVKQDLVLWNAGRHYGRVRLPILGRGWVLKAFIHTDTKLLTRTTRDNTAEPVMVLFPVWSDIENRGGGDDLEEKWNEINQGELMQLPIELL